VARECAGLALDHRAVDDALLVSARAAGLIVDVWTVNDPQALRAWMAKDVRWIETDRPDLAPPS
jgi:glycerophosphoryl diester phosphodiesterase